MKTPRNLDGLIRTYLREDPIPGQSEVPDHVYGAIRDGIEQTRQRAVIGSVGVPIMNKFVAIGLGAAAVVVLLFISANLRGSLGLLPGGEPSASAEPSAPADGGLPVGSTYRMWTADDFSIRVTIPAPGWSPQYRSQQGHDIFTKNDSGANAPDGAGMFVYKVGVNTHHVFDPCHWSMPDTEPKATTVDELVAAMSVQASRETSAPVDVAAGGYAGQSITLSVPDDAVFSDCNQEGQVNELWILNVDGWPVIFDLVYFAETPAEHVAEMRTMLESATFDLPSTEPSAPADAGLPVGSDYDIWEAVNGYGFSVTIPAPGWSEEYRSAQDADILTKNGTANAPNGAGMFVYQVGEHSDFALAPCHWSKPDSDTPATTVDELVTALSVQASRETSAPVNVAAGGYVGQSITLSVPDDAVFSDCNQAGQIDELWILNVDGWPVIFDLLSFADTPAEHVAEMRTMVESATFDLPPYTQ